MYYIFIVLSIIAVLYSCFFIVYRMFEKSGYKLKKIKLSNKEESYNPSRKECFDVFSASLAFRILIITLSVLIYILFIDGDFSLSNVFDGWVKWDAIAYLRISHGYSFYMENSSYVTLVFFPLFPLFIRIVSFVFNEVISGLIVSNIAFSIASVYLYKLVCKDYGKKTAKITLLLLNIFPFSFFFSGIMSESIFLLFSVLTLYYAREHKWFFVGLFGLLCALSRMIGVFIIIPVTVELIEEYKVIKRIKDSKYIFKTVLMRFLPLLYIPLGFSLYLYFNYRTTGEWFYFLRMQQEIWFQEYTHFFLFFRTSYYMIYSYEKCVVWFTVIPQMVITGFSYIVLSLNVKNKRTMYSVWLLINIIINTSVSCPLSVCRYFACAIPLFIFLADFLKNHRIFYKVYVTISILLFFVFYIAYYVYFYIY